MYEELITWMREEFKPRLISDFDKAQIESAAKAIEDLNKKLQDSENDNINLTGWLAEEHAKHQWIPVTERLPESVCKSYLCLADTGYHCEVRWTNNVYGLWKSDNNWWWSIFDVPQYCNVTHWMPLPEPPEGDE